MGRLTPSLSHSIRLLFGRDYNPAKISESSNNSKSVYLVNYTNREIN